MRGAGKFKNSSKLSVKISLVMYHINIPKVMQHSLGLSKVIKVNEETGKCPSKSLLYNHLATWHSYKFIL